MISLVTPAFREAENLPALHARLAAALDPSGEAWEWIVVDDHSPDATFDVLSGLAASDPRVRGLRLSRREGSHVAISAGLHRARGAAAIVLAADLQDPPETLASLLVEWRRGAQVVWATRRTRPGDRAHAGFAAVYYWVMRRVVGLDTLPANGADFFLADRVVLEGLARHPERMVSIFALVASMGFRQATVAYDKQPRAAGRSGWTLRRKVALVLDSVFAFSALPLRLISLTGGLLFLLGLAGGVAWTAGASGRLGLLAGMAALTGLQLAGVGVAGEYLWRTLSAARQRPAYLVESATPEVEGPKP